MREQKLRSFLTLLGVMAGVATVIMMVSFVVGFDRQVTAAFTSFGTHLVQFQKFEAALRRRWPAARGGAQPPRPDHRGRRGAQAPLEARARAVSQERYLFQRARSVRAGRNEANGARRLRHQPRLRRGQRPLHRRTAASSPTPTCATPPASASSARTSPTRSSRCATRSAGELTVDGAAVRDRRPLREEGERLRRQQRQLRGHPDLRLRPAVSRRSRTAAATPSTSPPCPSAPRTSTR